MDTPTAFQLEDVRCFQGVQRARLRPITFLVGENSTGKTTFLGCFAAVQSLFTGPLPTLAPNFNRDPFLMGSFRDIVRARRGPAGRIDEFGLALSYRNASGLGIDLSIHFREEGSQPVPARLRFAVDEATHIELCRSSGDETVVAIPGKTVTVKGSLFHVLFRLDHTDDLLGVERSRLRPIHDYLDQPSWGGTGKRHGFRGLFLGGLIGNLAAVAPLRAKPERTYNPVGELASPEGSHVPMLMMRLDRTEKESWKTLHDQLVAFGAESGLFSDIKVKAHGRQMSDPFQLQVKVRSGAHANLVDVGYGVSQSLPIIVDIMNARDQTFLLQQPEVHLHPRGQAELATFFLDAATKRRNRFLIETHSDYMLDRARIAVREGRIRGEDVSVLYFEPQGNAVEIHSLSVDRNGNLVDTPPAYRDFFAKETDRLLGFSD